MSVGNGECLQGWPMRIGGRDPAVWDGDVSVPQEPSFWDYKTPPWWRRGFEMLSAEPRTEI